jgi:hypothetical protein
VRVVRCEREAAADDALAFGREQQSRRWVGADDALHHDPALVESL